MELGMRDYMEMKWKLELDEWGFGWVGLSWVRSGPPTANTGPGAGHDCGPLVKNNAN